MIVVAIAGILASVALPAYKQRALHGKIKAAMIKLAKLRTQCVTVLTEEFEMHRINPSPKTCWINKPGGTC